ncbi:plasmid partitioning protein RepB [Salipiger marinus]|uniref:plasmid partitioning protein RepB n=1 Tax=Salipiger marinus TaxID=555512 RepID=UPI002C1BD06B|nr:plasmid partitioning protein RepB [Salipiger manganoxidans]MCD1618089.1 plasmid partitioning protein RepB [Salipiger manganoxidans]MEB3418771.1 plasmid partitioning protein RepB [Salipiger manganoxidans]
MARKVFGDSLKNAMAQTAQREDEASLPRTSPTVARAQASVLEEDKHATRLLDPGLIRMSAVMDRIDPSDGLDELVESIREHGQKVPVLVRRLADGGFEIVYGRRRLLACRELGKKVRATVMEMTDEEALIAQGVENNARQDPSFIERALFVAGIIRELGRTEAARKNAQTVAYRALQIDESLVSRMNRIATGIPNELIRAIGPAHGVGRRNWEKLFRLCEKDPAKAARIKDRIPRDAPAPARLEAAIALLTPAKPTRPEPKVDDRVRMVRKGNKITLDVHPDLMPRMEDAIRDLIAELLDRRPDGMGEG